MNISREHNLCNFLSYSISEWYVLTQIASNTTNLSVNILMQSIFKYFSKTATLPPNGDVMPLLNPIYTEEASW